MIRLFFFAILLSTILANIDFSESSLQIDSINNNSNNSIVSIDLIRLWNQHNSQILKIFGLISGQMPNGECNSAIKILIDDAQKRKQYALKMIDSTGRFTSGLLEGKFINLGQFSECIKAMNDQLFTGKYCLIQLSIPDQLATILSNVSGIDGKLYRKVTGKLGVCLPSTCTQPDIDHMAKIFSEMFIPKLSITSTQCVEVDSSSDKRGLFLLVLFIIICISSMAISILAAIYEHMKVISHKKTNGDTVSGNGTYTSTTKLESAEISDESAGRQSSSLMMKNQPKRLTTTTTQERLVKAFSIERNWNKIFQTDQQRDSINVFHGLKSLAMLWIIIQHSVSFGSYWINFTNQFDFKDRIYNVFEILLINGTFSVDIFLFISGYLVLHSLVRSMSSDASRWTMWKFYANRYLRMTPTMMFVIFFSVTVLPYWGKGPEWFRATIMFDYWCRHKWYLNMLYVHNTFQTETMCLSHSWYSAVDFQLFLFTPILTKLLLRKRWIGLPLTIFLLLASIMITAILTYVNGFPAIPYFNDKIDLKTVNAYYKHIYIKAYCRAGPYLIGVLLAYFMCTAHRDVRLSKNKLIIGWTFTAFATYGIMLSMLPANNGSIPNESIAALYSSLARNIFALGCAWITFVSITEQGGLFNRFISHRYWMPLGRLSYCAYLSNPIVIASFYGSRSHTFEFTPYLLIYLTISNIIVTYLAALWIALFIEYPLMALTKIILKLT